jgi:serine/threonine protein kinase
MNREQWRRVKSVAGAALGEPDAIRDEYVARLCQGDDELEREVRSLLSSALLASELFEVPAFAARGATVALDDATRPLSTRIGARIGSYRIIREIGRGGMGTVFLVERADDEYRQRVALKIAYDARSPSILERFREERQILATLDHPNIARLMDGGTTVDGLPYLVMVTR